MLKLSCSALPLWAASSVLSCWSADQYIHMLYTYKWCTALCIIHGSFSSEVIMIKINKCLLLALQRQLTDMRRDRQIRSEICSKPYISPALLSYWTLRPLSLHAALQIQPQGNGWEGQEWSVLTRMVDASNRITVFKCLRVHLCCNYQYDGWL